MALRADWVASAETGIKAVLAEQGAAVWPELEARLSDSKHASVASKIDPHHLTSAKAVLLAQGVIGYGATKATRGGREVPVLHLSSHNDDAAVLRVRARKRLLYARYLSWAHGTVGRSGIVGPGLERVLLSSLLAASPHIGLRVENPSRGETSTMFGESLPSDLGPLDNAAYWIDPTDGSRYAYPMESKNLRDWLYPSSQEVYQLLDKACFLSMANIGYSVVPVLVCRKAHKTLFYMAADLGFQVVDVNLQYLVPNPFLASDALRERLAQVRRELGFLDLRFSDAPDSVIVRQFSEVLPKVSQKRAERWKTFGLNFAEHFRSLHRENNGKARSVILDDVRQSMLGAPSPYDGSPRRSRGW